VRLSASLIRYKHFMLKEIMEQPEVRRMASNCVGWRRIASNCV